VDLVVDGGFCGLEPTTVVEIEGGRASVSRQGKGETAPLRFEYPLKIIG